MCSSDLAKRLDDARAEQRKAEGKLANAGFVERAPAEVVAEERERAERFGRDAADLEAQLARRHPPTRFVDPDPGHCYELSPR